MSAFSDHELRVLGRLASGGLVVRHLDWRPAHHSLPWSHPGARIARGVGGHWRLYRVKRGQWACYHGNAGSGISWEYPEFNKQRAQERAEAEHLKMVLACLCLEEAPEPFR